MKNSYAKAKNSIALQNSTMDGTKRLLSVISTYPTTRFCAAGLVVMSGDFAAVAILLKVAVIRVKYLLSGRMHQRVVPLLLPVGAGYTFRRSRATLVTVVFAVWLICILHSPPAALVAGSGKTKTGRMEREPLLVRNTSCKHIIQCKRKVQ